MYLLKVLYIYFDSMQLVFVKIERNNLSIYLSIYLSATRAANPNELKCRPATSANFIANVIFTIEIIITKCHGIT